MANAHGQMNVEMSADNAQRLQAAAKNLACGAIRVAAHKGTTASIQPMPNPPEIRANRKILALRDVSNIRFLSKRNLPNNRKSKKKVIQYERYQS